MSRRKPDSAQLSLLPPDPDLAEEEIKRLVRETIRRSPYSREQAAGFLKMTPAVLNACCAESKQQHKFPVSRLVALCRLTGDLTIIHRLCDSLGVAYHRDPREAMFAELGRLQVEREEREMREEELRLKLRKVVK